MKTNKNISENNLTELFQKVTLESPSSDFSEKLVLRLEKEIVKARKKEKLLAAGQLAMEISSMLLVPFLTIYLCDLLIPEFTFSWHPPEMDFNPNLIVTGISVLFLLIVDMLFIKYKKRKQL
ncbi:MAG: hypothetical protein LBR10_15555 [Prevotellaceae bacterium]|jgi:hypothetical protein|nr:hypothetical protein [Prevotellaceae bacterium]